MNEKGLQIDSINNKTSCVMFALTLLLCAQPFYAQEFQLLINDYSSLSSEGFTEYNGKLYFRADDDIHGRELWVTDGTEVGTEMLIDIHPDYGSSPNGFTEYDG